MNVHAREIIVPHETPLSAVCDVLLPAVEVPLRKAKINHVYRLVFWLATDNAVPELDVSVQHATRVHQLQARHLHVTAISNDPQVKGRGDIPVE